MKIKVEIPKGFMNTAVTADNFLIADTNDSANWKTFKVKLPQGWWTIFNVSGQEVTLISK